MRYELGVIFTEQWEPEKVNHDKENLTFLIRDLRSSEKMCYQYAGMN